MAFVSVVKSVLRPTYAALAETSIGRKLRYSRPAFERRSKAYFSMHPMYKKRSGADPALAELLENGLVILRSYFGKDLIQRVHDASLAAVKRVKANDYPAGWQTTIYEADGIYRIKNIETIVPEAHVILGDARLLNIMRGYLDGPLRNSANYLDYKPDIGKHDYTTVPHMDTWTSQIKIFTLLVDVDPLTAPLVYWRRSHRDAPWRRDFDYENFKGSERGISGVYPPAILRAREGVSEENLEEVIVTGSAGTVVIADTRGVHRASNLFDGYRLEIVQKFNPLVV